MEKISCIRWGTFMKRDIGPGWSDYLISFVLFCLSVPQRRVLVSRRLIEGSPFVFLFPERFLFDFNYSVFSLEKFERGIQPISLNKHVGHGVGLPMATRLLSHLHKLRHSWAAMQFLRLQGCGACLGLDSFL